MPSRNVVIGVVIVLIVLAGWYFIQSQKEQTSSPVPQARLPEATSATQEATPAETIQKNVVKISSSGFMPQNVTLKRGKSVTWMNEDTANHQVNSAVHPTHQIYPFLNNVGLLKSGESRTLSFPDPGTYRYHDHLNPSLTGLVTVE